MLKIISKVENPENKKTKTRNIQRTMRTQDWENSDMDNAT